MPKHKSLLSGKRRAGRYDARLLQLQRASFIERAHERTNSDRGSIATQPVRNRIPALISQLKPYPDVKATAFPAKVRYDDDDRSRLETVAAWVDGVCTIRARQEHHGSWMY